MSKFKSTLFVLPIDSLDRFLDGVHFCRDNFIDIQFGIVLPSGFKDFGFSPED